MQCFPLDLHHSFNQKAELQGKYKTTTGKDWTLAQTVSERQFFDQLLLFQMMINQVVLLGLLLLDLIKQLAPWGGYFIWHNTGSDLMKTALLLKKKQMEKKKSLRYTNPPQANQRLNCFTISPLTCGESCLHNSAVIGEFEPTHRRNRSSVIKKEQQWIISGSMCLTQGCWSRWCLSDSSRRTPYPCTNNRCSASVWALWCQAGVDPPNPWSQTPWSLGDLWRDSRGTAKHLQWKCYKKIINASNLNRNIVR